MDTTPLPQPITNPLVKLSSTGAYGIGPREMQELYEAVQLLQSNYNQLIQHLTEEETP